MLFGIHACGAEPHVAQVNFVAIMLENVERLWKLPLRDVRVDFREFSVAQLRHQLGLVDRIRFPSKAGTEVGDPGLRDDGTRAQHDGCDERRNADHPGQRYLFLFCSSRVRTRTRSADTKYI